jgi:putative acetyltransferase
MATHGLAVTRAPLEIRPDDLSDPRVHALLQEHLEDMHSWSPPGSVHALDLDGLRQPEISFWTAWEGETLLATGALKRIDPSHAEIKAMRTPRALRGRGAAKLMLEHLLVEATRRGYARLSLETGSQPQFDPARALYRRYGFVECGPFEGYTPDPHSTFMTLALR